MDLKYGTRELRLDNQNLVNLKGQTTQVQLYKKGGDMAYIVFDWKIGNRTERKNNNNRKKTTITLLKGDSFINGSKQLVLRSTLSLYTSCINSFYNRCTMPPLTHWILTVNEI